MKYPRTRWRGLANMVNHSIASGAVRVSRFSFQCRTHIPVLMLLALGVGGRAAAQGTHIDGVVRDTTGASVPDARVELHAGSYSSAVSTTPAGTFAFDNV